MQEYAEFIASKFQSVPPAGFDWLRGKLPRKLFAWQKDVVLWSLRIGRSALFLDTGLGKTGCQLAWAAAVAKHTEKPVLILCPLAVGPQTVKEAAKFGIKGVRLVETQADVGFGVCVTNYHKLHHFKPSVFGGVVLDESSILKSYTGKIKQQLCESFARVPYRLACTATPAPNDHMELGNHAEFLGIMSRVEMLATYFIHDSANTSEWRLKGHAERAFWEWVGSWAMVARRPSDLGYGDDGYDLPPLTIQEHEVESGPAQPGRLFVIPETTLNGQRQARRETLNARVEKAAELVSALPPDEPCLVWCELNDEADAVTTAIEGAVQVAGSDADAAKVERLNGFAEGRVLVLVTKAKIAGWGMNWQHCSRMVFVGLSHSYEQFYQSVRRCWRFGQQTPVTAHVITSDRELAVLQSVKEKQRDHEAMFASMVEYTAGVNRAALKGTARMSDEYTTDTAKGEGWELHLGDCVEGLRGLPDGSVHYSVFSPPFASLYTYSNSPRDMGNSRDREEFFGHFRYLVKELFRVLKPGRLVSFHCCEIPLMKERDGVIGVTDFPGDLIREFTAAGFIQHGPRVTIWKDPVIEMQRTKALGLLHKQVKKDSCMSRQGIPDVMATMRKPGVNPEPVTGRFESYAGTDGPELPSMGDDERYSIEVWQRYASPVWMDIDQTGTLNYRTARAEEDERHICPLQLGVIERCLDLWSNPGDLVLSPFAGIGSELYQAVLMGRRGVGLELKRSYFDVAVKNLERAALEARQKDLFAEVA